MTTSLITGAAGFVGSHVAEHCAKLGHMVIAVDDLSGGFIENLPENIQAFEEGSVTDMRFIERLFEQYRPDFVYHLAAYAAEALSHHIRRFNYETNLIGSVNLINAAVNAGTVQRFVFASSIAVYGTARLPWTENAPPRPIDPYGIAKYASELDIKAAQDMFGLPYTVFRPGNVYGPRQNLADPHRNAVAIFMRQCLRGQEMTVYGDGTQTRCFTYIDEVAEAIVRSVSTEGAKDQVINIGSMVPYSVNDLALGVASALGVEPRIVYLPQRHEITSALSDTGKAERIFGPLRLTTLTDGIARMAAWAKTQPLREPRAFNGIEIEKGLPEHWKQLSSS